VERALWSYNKRYMELYGAKQAALDIFRMLLLQTTDEDLNHGMRQGILTEKDALKAGMGEEFHIKTSEAVKRVFRGLRRVGFLNRMRLTVKYMRRTKMHYGKYPTEVEGFPTWLRERKSLFAEAQPRIVG
jgi:hypothetical protein